jgi:hypothetical protein
MQVRSNSSYVPDAAWCRRLCQRLDWLHQPHAGVATSGLTDGSMSTIRSCMIHTEGSSPAQAQLDAAIAAMLQEMRGDPPDVDGAAERVDEPSA